MIVSNITFLFFVLHQSTINKREGERLVGVVVTFTLWTDMWFPLCKFIIKQFILHIFENRHLPLWERKKVSEFVPFASLDWLTDWLSDSMTSPADLVLIFTQTHVRAVRVLFVEYILAYIFCGMRGHKVYFQQDEMRRWGGSVSWSVALCWRMQIGTHHQKLRRKFEYESGWLGFTQNEIWLLTESQ